MSTVPDPLQGKRGRIFAAYLIYALLLALVFDILAGYSTGEILILGLPGVVVVYIIGTIIGGALALHGAYPLEKQRWRRFRNGGFLGLFVGWPVGLLLFFALYRAGLGYVAWYASILTGSAITGYIWMLAKTKRDTEFILAQSRAARSTNAPSSSASRTAGQPAATPPARPGAPPDRPIAAPPSPADLAAQYSAEALKLEIVDKDTSWLLHRPIYDSGSDVSYLPCCSPAFESGSGPSGGWLEGDDKAASWAASFARRTNGATKMLVAADHLTFLYNQRSYGQGAEACRLVRTGPERWFWYRWTTGSRHSAADLDPPFLIKDMTSERWIAREQHALSNGEQNTYWLEEARKCGHAPSSVSGEPQSAFYWFNSDVISEPAHGEYGRFVYGRLLPLISPKHHHKKNEWFATFDGDCMTAAQNIVADFRPEDRPLLDEAKRIGESLCYVVAVGTYDAAVFPGIDSGLKGVLGYLGMTRLRSTSVEVFLRVRRRMALVPAIRIDGSRFTDIGYGFHSHDELEAFGFTEIVSTKTS